MMTTHSSLLFLTLRAIRATLENEWNRTNELNELNELNEMSEMSEMSERKRTNWTNWTNWMKWMKWVWRMSYVKWVNKRAILRDELEIKVSEWDGIIYLLLNFLSSGPGYVYTSTAASRTVLHLACSRLSDSGEDAKEKGTRKVGGTGKRKKEGRESFAAPAIPSLLPFYSRVCALSILFQRTRLSRSLKQAILHQDPG